MKTIQSVIILSICAYVAKSQHFAQTYNLITSPVFAGPGINYVHDDAGPQSFAHSAVVQNANAEAQLPQELLNPFYKNPRIAAGLAKESWFGDKEFPVFNRQADKIPREEIAKIVRRIQHQRRK